MRKQEGLKVSGGGGVVGFLATVWNYVFLLLLLPGFW